MNDVGGELADPLNERLGCAATQKARVVQGDRAEHMRQNACVATKGHGKALVFFGAFQASKGDLAIVSLTLEDLGDVGANATRASNSANGIDL